MREGRRHRRERSRSYYERDRNGFKYNPDRDPKSKLLPGFSNADSRRSRRRGGRGGKRGGRGVRDGRRIYKAKDLDRNTRGGRRNRDRSSASLLKNC